MGFQIRSDAGSAGGRPWRLAGQRTSALSAGGHSVGVSTDWLIYSLRPVQRDGYASLYRIVISLMTYMSVLCSQNPVQVAESRPCAQKSSGLLHRAVTPADQLLTRLLRRPGSE
jgi:hypothetical protein